MILLEVSELAVYEVHEPATIALQSFASALQDSVIDSRFHPPGRGNSVAEERAIASDHE